MGVNPLQIRKLEFYTIENIMKEYEEYLDKENKEYEKQQREITKQQGTMNGTKFGNFQVPKFDIPKFDTPK